MFSFTLVGYILPQNVAQPILETTGLACAWKHKSNFENRVKVTGTNEQLIFKRLIA